MALEKLIVQAPLLLPLGHVLVCFVFLLGYSTGFGANIGGLFSVGDLLTVALTDVAWVYISVLIIPLLINIHRFRPGFQSNIEKAIASGNSDAIDRAKKGIKILEFVLYSSITILVIISFIPTMLAIYYDKRVNIGIWSWIITSVIILAWIRYARTIKTSPNVDVIIALFLALLPACFLIAATRGQEDRRGPTERLRYNMTCGPYFVIRPASDKYLAVDRLGHRLVIDHECKAVLLIPDRRLFSNVTGLELMERWFQEQFGH